MDLKNEIENELAVAILVEKRHSLKIDDGGARELIGKIKGALDQTNIGSQTEVGALPLAEAAAP